MGQSQARGLSKVAYPSFTPAQGIANTAPSGDDSYMKKDTLLPEQLSYLQQILSQSAPYTQQAAQGYSQFLPGGGGGESIKKQAMQDYQQQTIPSILNAYGTGSKGSSALNQALASSASNLNTNIASQLAQMQLAASQGLGGLGLGGGGQGLGTQGFAYLQKQPPLWQQILLAVAGSAGQAAKGYATGGF